MKIHDYLLPLILIFLPVPALAWDTASMNTQIDQTNFVVNDGCSGTLIDARKGLVLTANHCVSDQFETIERETIGADGVVKKEKIRISKPGMLSQLTFHDSVMVQKSSYVFKILAHDAKTDLALVESQAKLPNTVAAKISCRYPVRGDVAYVVGNPYGVLVSSITKGIISSLQRNYRMLGIEDENQGDYGLVQISSGVVGGNSGGAVYNDDGELIGVPVRASMVNEIIGLSVPLDDIKAFLKENGQADLVKCNG